MLATLSVYDLKKALAGAALMCAVMQPASVHARSFMDLAGRTTQPVGHYEFCRQSPHECRSIRAAQPHALNRDDWQAMVTINNQINSAVLPRTDMQIWGREELWSYPTTVGDCEDFVLLKRHMLIERGFSPANLLITVVRQRNGEGHAVLTVRTDHGEFILDNLTSEIKAWEDTSYTYLKRQSSRHAGRWITINDHRMSVASVQ
ncbi:MAG: transglutaminase-like cysteine peptidase [Pseudomonadota bacterium]